MQSDCLPPKIDHNLALLDRDDVLHLDLPTHPLDTGKMVAHFLWQYIIDTECVLSKSVLQAHGLNEEPYDVPIDSWVASLAGEVGSAIAVVAAIYLERLTKKTQQRPNRYVIHRLYFIATIIASKVFMDDHISNERWSQQTKWSLQLTNATEYHFLQQIQWDLLVTEEQFFNDLHRMCFAYALVSGVDEIISDI
eukprot:Rmarinus@m.17670